MRTKQPEIKHEIKYSKYTACNKYTKKTKVSKVTKLTEIINKYEKDTDYDFDKETYDDIKMKMKTSYIKFYHFTHQLMNTQNKKL